MRYAAGTRYSNSDTYDEATDEFVHGWQVFVQKRANGEATGRRSFVNNAGTLCAIEIAEAERKRAIQDAAPDMLAALHLVVRGYGVTFQDAALRDLLRVVVDKACSQEGVA